MDYVNEWYPENKSLYQHSNHSSKYFIFIERLLVCQKYHKLGNVLVYPFLAFVENKSQLILDRCVILIIPFYIVV